jgi:FAD-dependent urate hydroxylase
VRDVADAVLEVLASGRRGALATLVRVTGSAPQQAGARLLLRPDGSLVGTVGGGAIEVCVVAALREAVRTGESRLVTKDLGRELGMCCGGTMEVFVEPIEAAPRLYLFGAGHVAKPTAALARGVGFDVTVIDARAELATAERFPGCRIELSDPKLAITRFPLARQDWMLIVTHDHRLDLAVLEAALLGPCRYVGLVGSRRKVINLVDHIRRQHGALELERLYAPVGLDLGAVGPDEIAVSIVAELVALRRGKAVAHLRAALEVPLLKVAGDADGSPPKRRLSLAPSAPGPKLAAAPARAEPQARALDTLVRRVERDLELLEYPRREWVTPRRSAGGAPIYDVIIVGAGQGGLATAFGLMRERVQNLLVVDQNPLDRAGPWLNFARMRSLRTPKHLTGPDLGIPSLTPRAWYEAQHGEGSWQALGLIPKETWADYLAWYRRTLQIPVRAETKVGALLWNEAERAWEVPVQSREAEQRLLARRVVLATGIEGSGQWQVPTMVERALPAHLYAHTRADIDFEALRGKRVAVLGAGASAFDNAATACDHGAAEVRLFFRRKQLVNVNSYRWAEFAGFLRHLGDLPDPDKWRFISQILRMGQLPPADTYRRAREHPGFSIHGGSAWKTLEVRGDGVVITTEQERFEVDFVIVATGFVTDLGLRPELALVEGQIARWSDRYTPPEQDANDDLLRHPYLGPSFEFTERTPGTAPYLSYLYNYTFGCLLSLGFGGASISGMKYSIPRLVSGITRSFFTEDRGLHFESLKAFAEREF